MHVGLPKVDSQHPSPVTKMTLITPSPVNTDRNTMVSAVDVLAAKISLLHHLHNLPELPSINELSPDISARDQPERTLTLKHEISITQHLAFICGYSSSPYHVTAICIEETLAQPSLILRLAANTGQHDGLVEGLTEVGQILQNEAGGGMTYPHTSPS